MTKLKVYGGFIFIKTDQCRTIVATTSQRIVAELLDLTLHEIQNYWSITGNEEELAIALANPGRVFVKEGQVYHDGNWYELDEEKWW